MDDDENFQDSEENIRKEIITQGDFGRKPSLGWICHVKIEVMNPEIISIHSDYVKEKSLNVSIGKGDFIVDRLIEECIETMKINEESKYIIPLKNQELTVKISLESVIKQMPYIYQWTSEEKLQLANSFKSDGVELFKQNKIKHAFVKFSKAVKMTLLLDSILESEIEENSKINTLRTALYNNLASCQLHFKHYLHVIELCNKSLEIEKTIKAYFRRALAYIEMKDYEKAEKDLIEILKIEPANKAALEKIHLVRFLDKENRDNYNAIVKKMFSG